jgi:SAM-dependent methyltransferase
MSSQTSEMLEKIRQQFDSAPYPRIPVDESPKENPNFLYMHNLVTPYYLRNQKVIDTKDKIILDAGCGTGYKSLVLAEANPGAKIVGVDISEESVKLARQRLDFHGFDNVEFHVLLLEDLPKLGLEFDYINCDDVLYLLPDGVAGLQAMKSVLKPDGIIRANLHSSLQRSQYYRAQNLFKYMGLMDSNPEEMEIGIVRDVMKALKDNVELKVNAWSRKHETEDDIILANHLLVGDKGSTIPEFFLMLQEAGLEFINMVNWWQWNLMDLFQEPDNLPAFLAMSLPEATKEQKLHMFELLHPRHRLLDIWCGHSNAVEPLISVEEWTNSDWKTVQVHLHPLLKTEKFKKGLTDSIQEMRVFNISGYLSTTDSIINIDSSMASCLLPLLNSSQSMESLVKRWKEVRPINAVTLQPTDTEEAFNLIQQLLFRLESLGYILLEKPSPEAGT